VVDRAALNRPTLNRVALALGAAAVLAQIAYPLLDGPAQAAGPLRAATVTAVLLFCAASLTHAAATSRPRTALTVLTVAGGVGLVAEAVGVATGVPFGRYAYAGTLGPQLLGVPLLVPLAWTMMAWPTLLAGRALAARVRSRGSWTAVPPAAVALAAWDLFLDPQMVAAGHWTWAFPEPGLPGVPGVPLTNFAGWLVVAFAVQALLHAAVPAQPEGDPRLPALLLGWTWLGSTLANAAFFGRPAVAAHGFVAMGVVVAPYLTDVAGRRRLPRRFARYDASGPIR
jgi:putative membrane protein